MLDSYYFNNIALQSWKAVTAYFESKQLLDFGFARQNTLFPYEYI